jgi:hypothetical protein
VMLIAKYAKFFPRTGTLPFLLGCRAIAPYTPKAQEQFLAHWYHRDVSYA